MADSRIDQWENAIIQSDIHARLPKEPKAGDKFEEMSPDGIFRQWAAVDVISGNIGGRWAYWLNQAEFKVVADLIFNGTASHFVGLLVIPFVGQRGVQWVMTSPRVEGQRIQTIPDEPKGERYERSREIFDVTTQKTTKI